MLPDRDVSRDVDANTDVEWNGSKGTQPTHMDVEEDPGVRTEVVSTVFVLSDAGRDVVVVVTVVEVKRR